MTEAYLVSILLPTFNSGKFIDECLRSILNQNHKLIEVIIVDNSSNDNTLNIVNLYKKKLNIKVYQYKTKNLASALNFGISKCNGDFIARVDSDDIIRKNRIKKQLKFLLNNQYIFVGTHALRFSNNKLLIKPFLIFNNDEDLKLNLFFQSSFIHPTIMFNRKKILDIGSKIYDESMDECEDYDLWIRLIDKTKFKNIKYNGIYYRVHENSASLKKKDKLNNYFSKINKEFLNEYNIQLDENQFKIHRKICELNIYAEDDFDILNQNYIDFLFKIKKNIRLHKQYKLKNINKFISKKYYRFCFRAIRTKNFSFLKCFNKEIQLHFFYIPALLITSILKIKI